MKELLSFDFATPIDALQVALATVQVRATAQPNSTVKATVDAQKFVRVLGTSGDYLKVRTAGGVVGFINKKFLDPARIVETLDLTFDGDKEVDKNSYDRLASVLRRVVATDAVVQYPSGDKEDGLGRATDVGLIVTRNQLSRTSTFIPKIVADDTVPSGTVRLTIAAFALESQEREKPEAIPISGPTISVATATQASTAVSQGNAALQSCQGLTASVGRKDPAALAYLRYDGSSDQYALAARVLAVLSSVGFRKAPLQKIETSLLPVSQGEICHCPQLPASISEAAIDALRACGLGEYKNVQVSGASCQQAPRVNLGIWLAQPPVPPALRHLPAVRMPNEVNPDSK